MYDTLILNNGKIYNRDVMDVMGDMSKGAYDMVITSPPYNNSRQSGKMSNHERRYLDFDDNMTNDEYLQWTINLFNHIDRTMSDDGVVLYNMNYGGENPDILYLTMASIIVSTNFMIADTLIWKKKSAIPNNVSPNKVTRITEFVFVICRKSEYKTFRANKKVKSRSRTGQKYYENVYNIFEAPNNNGPTPVNKATFSTEMVDELLQRYGHEDLVVFDPFMGTGTTAVACEENNVKYIGAEISTIQFNWVMENRLKKYIIDVI